MPDTIEERLALLGTSLEDAAGFGSPATVRGRGDHLRTAHRRRMVAMTAATAVIAVVGVGSAVAMSGGGGRQTPVSPGSSSHSAPASPDTSAPDSASPSHAAPPPATSKPPATVKTTAVVDLKQHTMTVSQNGKVVRTIAVTAGKPSNPSLIGSFSVLEKQELLKQTNGGVGDDYYDTNVRFAVVLDGGAMSLYAAPWAQSQIGKADTMHRNIGMSTADAQWFYNTVAVGDRVQVR